MFIQTPEEAYLDSVIVDLSLRLKAVSAQLTVAEKEAERLRAALQKIAEWDLTGTAVAALGEKE